jgi:hypothetical protein
VEKIKEIEFSKEKLREKEEEAEVVKRREIKM